MANVARPPIILVEGRDVNVFPSLEALLGDVEAVDVLDGVYRVFDSTGTVITLTASSRNAGAEAEVTGERDAELLRQVVIGYARAVRPNKLRLTGDLEAYSTDELLGSLMRAQGRGG